MLLSPLLFFNSCQKEEVYSCDATINSWVKNNKSAIVKFDRKEIASYSHSYEKAILRAIPIDRKQELWQEKVNYILTLQLPKEEMDLLKWYAEMFQRVDYHSKNEHISKELQELMYQKVKDAMKNYGWSREFVYNVFFRIGNIGDNNSGGNSVREQGECDCNWNIGCPGHDDCEEQYQDCTETDYGCGIFGNGGCYGECNGGGDDQQQ